MSSVDDIPSRHLAAPSLLCGPSPACQRAYKYLPVNQLTSSADLPFLHWHAQCIVHSVLRITSHAMEDSLTLKLEGSLKGPWVDELQKAWSSSTDGSSGKPVKVDLAGVSFIDPKARNLLLRMQGKGVRLEGASIFLRHLLDEQDGKTTATRKAAEEYRQ
jgi:ABC-type transporter Mla MlaB component